MEQNHQEQQEKLLEKFNRVRKRIIRNKLIIISILNFATLIAFIIAMAYYKWVWVRINITDQDDPYEDVDVQIWANLLFMKQDVQGTRYRSFTGFSHQICKDNIYCFAVFYEFSFVGYLCFGIFVIAGLLQLYDFGRLFYLICVTGYAVESKDNFRHLVTVFTYLMGITLSWFSLLIINPTEYRYGTSFYLGLGTLVIFVTVIIYEQYSVRKMIKQSLVLKLLQKQKKVRAEQIKNNMEIQMTNKQMSLEDELSL